MSGVFWTDYDISPLLGDPAPGSPCYRAIRELFDRELQRNDLLPVSDPVLRIIDPGAYGDSCTRYRVSVLAERSPLMIVPWTAS